MTKKVVVSGGGIGGLAAALALARSGLGVALLEQSPVFGEVGAGLQLGPNAVRVLDGWGLSEVLRATAAFPEALQVRDAHGAQTLGRLRLGPIVRARYGQPYATLHRADLHEMLLEAVQREKRVSLHLGCRVASYEVGGETVRVTCENDQSFEGAALIGSDGLWSRVRNQMLGATPVRASGHLAYRGMVRADELPAALRSPVVTAWLGPRLHAVHYPVRRGEWFNVVVVVQGVIGQGHGGAVGSDPQSWSHEAHASDLRRTLGPACGDLLAMVDAVRGWKLWPLNDRAPVAGAHEHAQGRVALLGDAAHPLRPYLAQGAAMAIEDAWTLGRLTDPANGQTLDWPSLLDRYARTRWARNARVQTRSERNGTVFHATGPLKWARNAAMATLGESLLDNPWLYSGPPEPV
ncbi:FAD-dependent monooxygenase [Hydrogenophaga sp. PAMC20947]|uniref:FAD-dependent monooxygenase n=1 Tax=Hydrogenophaga sp. PAMC20947 TaxID=2565558 RepID=UPI00109D8E92|nr:FAD-dependent monooxygenase [Hydrogenophaga sp. PAMC20947]QCB44763.1 FAD-dependent oxidoreductase [Hydrogenophaga sp. PAMC20947]